MQISTVSQDTVKVNYVPTEVSRKLQGTAVFEVVEEMPEFPGGEQALLHYLAEQTSVYASSHEQEYLRVRVIIEKDGGVTHPYFILDRNPLGKNPFFRKAALEII